MVNVEMINEWHERDQEEVNRRGIKLNKRRETEDEWRRVCQ